MMGHRETLRGGNEYDAFTRWRRVIIWKSGEIKAIKKRFNRRIRRREKILIRMEIDCGKINR